MREPTPRRIIFASTVSLCIGVLLISILNGLPPEYPMRLIQGAMAAAGGIAVAGLAVAFVTTRLADYRDPSDEEDFEELVRRSERLARENLAAEPDESDFMQLDPYNPRDFEELVRDALDDLPDMLRRALERNVAVIIRDTLLRDFGHDAEELRAQVLRTVRHELAHHLGADELGVRDLGL